MKDFRDLLVWKKSHEMVLKVYRTTVSYPKSEMFGLTSQSRRCAASIPANIAEGCGRGSDADFGRHVQIAMGSASELEYHLLLAKDLGFLSDTSYVELNAQATEVKRMLTGLLKKLRG